MSSEQDRARELAERIARRLAAGDAVEGSGVRPTNASAETGGLSATLSEIQRRLTHIEAHLSHDDSCGHDARREDTSSHAPASTPSRRQPEQSSGETGGAHPAWLSGTYVPATISHPSQERFSDIGEAVSELVEMFEREKSCNIEPGAKPCDHCGMCSSRGF